MRIAERPGAHRRPRQEHRQARRSRSDGDFHPQQADARRRAHGRAGAAASSRTCSTPTPARSSPRRWRCGRRRGDRRDLHLAVPRAADLHDGGSAQHHASARICCSAPRTSSASATTPPTSPRPCYYMVEGTPLADERPKGDTTSVRRCAAAADMRGERR